VKRTLPARLMAPARHFFDGATHVTCGREDRARVIAMYDAEVRALERCVGRDLSRWLTP